MWISEWKPEKAKASGEDGEEGLEGVGIVVCGWKKESYTQQDLQGADNALTYVRDKIKKTGLVTEDKPSEDLGQDEKNTLDVIKLGFKFAPVASIGPNPKKKGKGRR